MSLEDVEPPAPAGPPRIGPGARRDVGLPTWAFAHVAGRVTRTTPPAIFLTLGRHRRLFRGWMAFARRLMPGGLLPRRESELLILRVALLHGSAYEFAHHVRLGRRAGVTEADVRRLASGAGAPGWRPRERVLLTAVEELHADGDLADATWAELGAHLDERERIELCLLVGHYAMLATTLRALRVAPDAPRRGGTRHRPAGSARRAPRGPARG